MLQILMDSAGDLPDDWLASYDIHVIPINIHFGEQAYLQGIDLSNTEFYRMARQSAAYPKTSQPSPQQFIDCYRKIARIGDTVLSLHVTGKLSGTFASAVMASRELAGELNIKPFDTGSGSAAMGYMCREARMMDRAGRSFDEIVKRLEYIRSQIQIVLTLDTLEFALRSGRVKTLQAALASLLNVKPVIFLKEGALEMGKRVRTRSRSLEYVVDEIAKRLGGQKANIGIVHSEDHNAANILLQLVQNSINCAEIITTELSIGVAANLGPGTVGLVAYPVGERASR